MSASDNLSTKCSGSLLRSSFAILVARARHLFSAVPMPAFSGRVHAIKLIRHGRSDFYPKAQIHKSFGLRLARDFGGFGWCDEECNRSEVVITRTVLMTAPVLLCGRCQ